MGNCGNYPLKNRCEPAYTVVTLFGGVRATAKICKCSEESVRKWLRPPEIQLGLGGFVPLDYWNAVLKHAWVHRLPISKKTLYLGRRRRERLSAMQKRKGDTFERQVASELRDAGFLDAHRMPLSGAVAGYDGDVRCMTPRGQWKLQLKIHGARFSVGYTQPIQFLRDAAIGRIQTPWGDFIGMNCDIFFRWLRGEKIWALNFPVLALKKGAVLHRDMNHHHALVFRRSDGNKEWYVIFPEQYYWDPLPRHKNGKIMKFNDDGTIKWEITDPVVREANAHYLRVKGPELVAKRITKRNGGVPIVRPPGRPRKNPIQESA